MIRTQVFLFSILMILTVSCSKDKTEFAAADCPDPISFANDVKPIIDVNCATSGCHDANTSTPYEFANYDDIAANANLILSVIRHETGVTPMPLNGNQLADSLIQKINCWVIQGKLDN